MSKLPLLASADAPPQSKAILDATQAKIHMVPNLYRALAASPAALKGYVEFAETLNSGILPAKTRESLAVAIAEANRCEYCLSAHTAIGKMVGLHESEILLARDGKAENAKLEAILGLARRMVVQRGMIADADFQAAQEAGVTHAEFAEIAANVALHTYSNYFNNLAGTEIDFPRVHLTEKAGGQPA